MESQQKEETITSETLSKYIVDGMQEKKAMEVTVIDLRNVNHAIADFFVLCSGNSDTQIDAISDSVEDVIHKHLKQNPWRKEGKENREWIILDYVDVVAHIFNKEKRSFYGLEDLWGDAKISRIEENY